MTEGYPPTTPDHLFAPGSLTFFFDPRTGRLDLADYPVHHTDMLNRDGGKLGREYFTPDQHDFEAVPLTRSKATILGIVAGRVGEYDGRPLISIWNRLDDEATRKVVQALLDQVAAVQEIYHTGCVSTDGYHQGTAWRPLRGLVVPESLR